MISKLQQLALFLITSAVLVGVAPAEDLVLVDGRYLHVDILGATKEAVEVIILETGGRVQIPWALIRESDRDRLLIKFGLKEEALEEVTVPGVRLVTRSGEEFYGVPLLKFTAEAVPEKVEIQHHGTKWPFEKKNIRSIEWVDIPALEAYTKVQLYDLETKGDKAPAADDLERQWEMARFSTSIGFYEKAVIHYLAVRNIDASYRQEYVSNQLARLEVLARNQRILDTIKGARRDAFYNRYDRSVATLDQVLSVDDLDASIKTDTELLKENVLKRRWNYYQKQVARWYLRQLDLKLAKLSRERKLTLREAQKTVRRDLHKEIIANIAETFGLDAKTEVEKMWKERKVNQQRTGWYGSGSFVVLGKAKGAQERDQRLQRQLAQAAQQQRRSGGRNAAQPMKLPKLQTKDEWWESTDSSSRASWMKAYFAENGKQLKITGERRMPCGQCGSRGSVPYSGAQGETIPVNCPRCHGHKFDKGVSFK